MGVTMMLTVSDIERLAKAGVQIDIKELVRNCEIMRDPDQPALPEHHRPPELEHAIYDRMRASMRARNPGIDQMSDFTMHPFWPDMKASSFKDKVYVFVSTGTCPPLIIEDDVNVFPSDALIAKLHLLREAERGKESQGGMDTATANPVRSYRHNGGKLIP